MDWSACHSFLLVLVLMSEHVSGQGTRRLKNLKVHILEENITVSWDPLPGTALGALYQVQMTTYGTGFNWVTVEHCGEIQDTHCDVSSFVKNYTRRYLARVRLLTAQGNITWAKKPFTMAESELLPPSFDLSASSSSLSVIIHRKPNLNKLFKYGVQYTVYLHPKGQENQTLMKRDEEEQGEVHFDFLQMWQEYCISLKVEVTSVDRSKMSPEQCILLQPDMSLIISLVNLSVLGIVALLVLSVCCFLRRPGKMPVVLKSSVSGWHPLSLGVVPVEIVMDNSWLLTSRKMEGKGQSSEERKAMTEEEEDEERRLSLDSGVSIDQHSSESDGGREGEGDRQEDSGCGSLGETEDNFGNRRGTGELPPLDGRSNCTDGERREDSGLGMGCHNDVAGSLEGEDCGLLPEMVVVIGDGYRSQSSPTMGVQTSEKRESLVPTQGETDTDLAAPAGGYRSGQVTCLCSREESCLWCQARKHNLTKDSQSATKAHPNSIHIMTATSDQNTTISSYLKKTHLQTVTILGLEDTSTLSHQTQSNCSESAPFLISLPEVSLEDGGLNCNMDPLSLFTLHNVELTFS